MCTAQDYGAGKTPQPQFIGYSRRVVNVDRLGRESHYVGV